MVPIGSFMVLGGKLIKGVTLEVVGDKVCLLPFSVR